MADPFRLSFLHLLLLFLLFAQAHIACSMTDGTDFGARNKNCSFSSFLSNSPIPCVWCAYLGATTLRIYLQKRKELGKQRSFGGQHINGSIMAWTCSGFSNASLVQNMEKASLISTALVGDSFRRVDRGWFVPKSQQSSAYKDMPLPIGYGATISAPHMHAIMVEILFPFLRRDDGTLAKTVLDIGSGSGYLSAVLADLCGEGSKVFGVEHVKELQQRSMEVVMQHFPSWKDEGRITFIHGDGQNISMLFPGESLTFDVIHVGAAAASLPHAYLEALKPGGCLVIPIGEEDSTQVLRVFRKDMNGNVHVKNHGGVRFVPLTSLKRQMLRA